MNSATASCHDDQVDKELTDAGGRLPEATHVCDLTEQCASSSPAYIPDGGWGWFVVFSAFISEAFLDGLAVSVGVLLVTFKEYFDEEAGKVSLISSLGQFVFFCSCPISSSIGKHVGERRVAMIGGVMTSAGLVVSAFVTDVTMLYFTMSFLMNFGLSLSFLPSFSLLGKYFEKRHGLANALATAGYGLGIMGLPPLCQILIQGYGWRGTLIILSAMSANLSVAGALLRPLCSNEKIARQDGKSLDREHRCLRFVRLFGFHIIYLQPSIMGITLAIGFIGAASGIFITFFMQRLDEIGVDRVDASLLNTVVGAAALSIRLIYGWFIDLRVISPE
ncbi:monocarboxylate transporter 13-like isoform X1 [Ptychodera flava]|uniref:monocarboxylate transporter 13-like isoform X1 n=1 Tax=Ptychodera flava TaxID=63121 RepID=UPI00396A4850